MRQERAVQLVPARKSALLVVADAGVHQDAPALRLDDEGVDRHQQAAFVVGKVRLEPVVARHQLARRVFEEELGRRGRGPRLDDLSYPDVADLPLSHDDTPGCNVGCDGRATLPLRGAGV